MSEQENKPAGTKAYTCSVLRGRNSSAPTFDAWGDDENEAIRKCFEQADAARARVTRVMIREFTADGKGFMFSNLMFGGRQLGAKEARARAGVGYPEKPKATKAETTGGLF
jgi:hypothetical protein